MKCRFCNADTHVLSTREQHEFILVRRRECEGPDLHRFNTLEVLQQYLSKLSGTARRKKVLAHFTNGAARRRLALERREQVRQMQAAGVKQEAISAELGVSLACVRDHAVKLRNGQPGRIGRPRKVRE